MTSARLQIRPPDTGPYVLGAPMHLYDGATHVASLDPVPVNREGTEVLVAHFTPMHVVSEQKKEIGKLALVEIAMFLAENFTTVQTIRFSLGRNVEGYGDGVRLAVARSAFLQSIGAADVLMVPQPDAELMGHFVVTGIWTYNPTNLASLAEVLEAERQAYAQREAAAAAARRAARGSWMRRLFQRPPQDDGAA